MLDMSGIAGVAFAPQITAAAARHGLDPRLLAAVAAQETGGPGSNSGANVVGDGGHGHGLFQIDDRWHAFASTPAAMDPARNAEYAAGLIGGLLKRFGGNVHAALSAYNAGSPTATGTTTNWGHGVNVGYADSVLLHYAQLGGTAAGLNASGAGTASASTAVAAARDAAVPDLADLSAQTNGLRAFASAATGTMIGGLASPAYDPTASQVSAAFGNTSAAASVPCPSVPQSTPPSQAQQSQKETALVEDLGNDDDDGSSPSGPSASS
jgi:hypothetical protein